MKKNKKQPKEMEIIIEPSEEKIDLVEFVEMVLDWGERDKTK